MARPKKLTRDPDKKARTLNEIQAEYQVATRMYLATGGDSIDTQIRALDRTQRDYESQMDSCEQHGKDVGAWGPTVSRYESRMTAGVAVRLHKQREDKMAQCLLWAEEGAEARAEGAKVASASSPMAAVPEVQQAAETPPSSEPQGEVHVPFAPDFERLKAMLGGASTAAIGGTPMPLQGQSPPSMNRKERRAAERAARHMR